MADESNPFDEFDTATEAQGNPFDEFDTVENHLAGTRSEQAKQLEDPKTAVDLFRLTKNEVGSQGAEAQQAFIETVFNRSKSRNQTLAQTINDRKYYPKVSFKDVPIGEDTDTSDYKGALENVLKGGNISGLATGNASGTVGFAGGPQTAAFGGERFGIEGPDLNGASIPSNPFDEVDPRPPKEATDNAWSSYMPETLDTDEEVALANQLGQDHPVFKNAVDAASEILTGFIPKDPLDIPKMIVPQMMAFQQAKNVISSDKPLDAFMSQIPLVARIPEIIHAEQTPPGSKERWEAGFKTINDILMVAGIGKAANIKVPPPAKLPPVPPFKPSAAPASQFAPAYDPVNPVPGSGKFRATYQVDKELGDMMEGIGAAKEAGHLMGETASRRILGDLNPAQQSDVGRFLVSERLKLENPNHPQILSDADAAKITANKDVARAIDEYRNVIEPEVEALHMRAGVTESAAGQIRGKYITLIPKTEEMLPQFKVPPQIRASQVSKLSKFAREAKGLAKEYDTDLRSILGESYSEANRKALLNDFYKTAKRKGITDTDKFEDLPPEIANNLNDIIGPKSQPTGALAGWRAVQRGATSIALTANPAELMNHMRRQLNLLASKPPVGQGWIARLEALVPYIGPKTGAFVRSVMDDMSKAENMAVLQDIFNAGGGSSRSFSHMYELRSSFAKYTGLKWLQKKTHNMLFGIPKGRGIQGWDLRMRVQLEKIRRAAEGNRDPQRIREFANQIGQYGAHPDWIISALRELNPYAATTLPMRLTELKTAVGMSGLKHMGTAKRMLHTLETQLRGTGGTILALTTANKLLSGKWPWENDPGHEFDLNTGLTGKDGKRQYLKFRVIGPELSRPVNTVGLPNLARERTASAPQYLSAITTALANQGLSLVSGPAQNAALMATTGKAAYLVKSPGRSPELMDLAKTEEGQSRGLEQLKRAGAGLNPLGEAFVEHRYEPELTPALALIERPLFGFKGVRPFGSMFSESFEKKKPKRPPSGARIRAELIKKAKRKASGH